MTTVIEDKENMVKSQLRLVVKTLIKHMNSESGFDITIVEEEEKNLAFEFLLEYPPYQDNRLKLQRRVSNLEAEEFIANVMENIETVIGCKYNREGGFIRAFDPTRGTQSRRNTIKLFSDSNSKLRFYKKLHINIDFVEERRH